VANELSRLEHELFEADWAKAKEKLGREPTIAELPRTSGQRRADALKEMAIRSRTAPADGRRPAPSFSILVDYPTLAGRVCELAQGIVVSPGSLVPWLTEAYFERAVFTPGTRVEVSPTARLFTGATKRAIELRDRECTHSYCDRSTGCQVDHVIPYAEGGPTTQEINGGSSADSITGCGTSGHRRTGSPLSPTDHRRAGRRFRPRLRRAGSFRRR
jgi:hypothetical protein